MLGMILVSAVMYASGVAPPEKPGYVLAWSDEFDSPGRPSPDNWSFEEGFSRNRELQWYQPDNASVRDGLLVIEARREQRPNPNHEPESSGWKTSRPMIEYTSSSLRTKGKHEWLYGVFEMRARIDTRAGMWPAWWTLGSARGWPGCGEIDIMEYYRGMLLANTCWQAEGDRWSQQWDAVRTPLEELGGDAWSEEFHVWRMEWDEDAVRLYVDDRLLNETDVNTTFNPDGSNPFREPHFMLVNLAIGGDQGGDPSESEFPAAYEIDYIRVYQKTVADEN